MFNSKFSHVFCSFLGLTWAPFGCVFGLPRRPQVSGKLLFTIENVDFRKGTGATKDCKNVPLGKPLGVFWAPFGRPLGSFGVPLSFPEHSLAYHLGIIRVPWVSLSLLGPALDVQGSILDPFWYQRPFWRPFGLPRKISGHLFWLPRMHMNAK